MKITLIDKNIDSMGGVERVLNTLSVEFSKKNEVSVISEVKSSKKPFFDYKNINVLYMIDETHNSSRDLKQKNINYYIFRSIEKIKEKYAFSNISNEILSCLKQSDIIIFGRVHSFIDFIPIIKKYRISSKIIVRDAIHFYYFDRKVKKKIKKYFPKYVNTFIVSSKESKDIYNDFFGNTFKNIKIVYNPLGIIPSGSYDKKAKIFVAMGRLNGQKGFENLIKAFSRIYKNHNDWILNIYGSGPDEMKLKSLINQENMDNHINIYSSANDVVKVLNKSSIFIMTSRFEGYANMLVEAMTCGMPVISYDWLLGIDEIIKDNFNGLIVHLNNRTNYFKGIDCIDDINNLSIAMDKLASNEGLCDTLANNAKKIIESRSIKEITKEWYKIFDGD